MLAKVGTKLGLGRIRQEHGESNECLCLQHIHHIGLFNETIQQVKDLYGIVLIEHMFFKERFRFLMLTRTSAVSRDYQLSVVIINWYYLYYISLSIFLFSGFIERNPR